MSLGCLKHGVGQLFCDGLVERMRLPNCIDHTRSARTSSAINGPRCCVAPHPYHNRLALIGQHRPMRGGMRVVRLAAL